MIDFIEYVVCELQSKRLSKGNALALIEQFSGHATVADRAPGIHPLLHRNTSDLTQQSYTSSFTGAEFFLRDHRVHGKRMLPAVAYLEMIRAAMADALPQRRERTTLELRNVVWAQPVVVAGYKEVALALSVDEEHAGSAEQVDFEIYSAEETQHRPDGGATDEVIHCQGQAVFTNEPTPRPHDIESLRAQMTQGRLEAAGLYPAIAAMGIDIGPAHQGIKAIYQGERQQLAHICLPDVVNDTRDEYVLHPSIMDSVLQAATSLVLDLSRHADHPPLPFALGALRIFSSCKKEMFSWARYSAGSQPGDSVAKLDIDLCDDAGNICVTMQGFSSRVLSAESAAAATQDQGIGRLLAVPEWESAGATTARAGEVAAEPAQRHVILCDIPNVDAKRLEPVLRSYSHHGSCLEFKTTQQTLAGRYSEVALACFGTLQTILRGLQGRAHVQVVIAHADMIFSGLSGLLKTATLENPQLLGQIIVTTPDVAVDELASQLQQAQQRPHEPIVKYQRGEQHLLRWRVMESHVQSLAFKDRGVYLLTGGLGGLGVLFAREILRQTLDAKVILTGRSALIADKQVLLERLSAGTEQRVFYRQLHLGDLDQVRQFLAAAMQEFGHLDGIIHSAGMIADAFILKKTPAEFSRVLEPKVTGTFNLDEASQDIDLDFLALFSAGAAVHGNAGQADYAAANGFMDQFAGYRNRLVTANSRRGLTVSINWPLWHDGGMSIDAASLAVLQRATGMHPMQTQTGIWAFYQCLGSQRSQVLVVEGDLQRIHRALLTQLQAPAVPEKDAAHLPVEMDASSLIEKTQNYLRKQFAVVLKLPAHKIDPLAPLEKYGIDSIVAMSLTHQLELTFGSLPKTLFFEYRSIRELTEYFGKSYADKLAGLFAAANTSGSDRQPSGALLKASPEAPTQTLSKVRAGRHLHRRRDIPGAAASPSISTGPIAIVGLSGRYPESIDIEAYWRNLRDGKDCIVEVPKQRWDWREFFTEDRSKAGHHYSKWGGFIEGVDEFDPLFFNISPREARIMDPQERLFLQHAWMAVEDAGYTRAALQGPRKQGQVGVYVGVMYGEYNLSGSLAGVANRVSSVLNLHGPSMTLDTMCSSSLTAIHLACQDLQQGRTDLAIAGGVNVSIHPSKYLMLSAGQFIASDGHCQSFGEGGDGYIPAEGVGAVVLKRLADAQREGDHIYGIIKGSALNHGGRTNGYTVPNPQAQASVISQALAEANTNPRHVTYIEAHGTGTKLGDPIEIAALNRAFYPQSPQASPQHAEHGFCAIGSAKSNIGHCESAAGIAGLTKVLLQMQHQQIVPSLHSARLNPHIDFDNSPFVVNQLLRPWVRPVIEGRQLPRTAGISSFGAGGSNAHVVVEEYIPSTELELPATHAQVMVPLSARTAQQLVQRARDLLDFIRTPGRHAGTLDLPALAYTLQAGREAMEERLGFVVGSAEQLAEKLQAYIDGPDIGGRGIEGGDIEGAFHGQVQKHRETLSVFNDDPDFQDTIDKWIARKNLSKPLELWVKGLELNWHKLYGEIKPRRISLPTYPFAKEKYWIEPGQGVASAVSRPLVTATALPHSEAQHNADYSSTASIAAKPQSIQLSHVGGADTAARATMAAAKPKAVLRIGLQEIDSLPADEPTPALSLSQLQRQLAASLAAALYMDVADIDSEKSFVDLGLDSIVGVEWVKVINKQNGLAVAATRIYDYPNIKELASFVAKEIAKLPAFQHWIPASAGMTSLNLGPFVSDPIPESAAHATEHTTPAAEKIAIVGMSGRYPQANNLRQYWDNLAQGKNSIVEIPSSRWNVDDYYDPDPTQRGKIYCKQLGLLDDVDCFDPLFFQISPAEAHNMDPQHRLFMQEAYRAFEDAGYSNKALSNTKCGVYLGIMSNEYALLLARDSSFNADATGTSYAIGAARIAYYLNLKGPAIPIDTACSSSLVAIHLACQALLSREIDMALAGGVSLYLTADSYVAMCQLGMLSPDGQCKTFDDSADGFVPGEGVGALVLKRLQDAQANNDCIYGVILGSGINQDGKTNGITAPSVSSQVELERDLYVRHRIDPETISYVETHGTGTKLGDPIELQALASVFGEKTAKRNFCALGSVKTNIGHTSGAAGVASVQKVLLSMRHRTLVPSLNVTTENALFDFQRSPFYICREKHAWSVPAGSLRRAAVSSFGFSGTNAHLVIEEYLPQTSRPTVSPPTHAVLLSARTSAQLTQKARDLLAFVLQEHQANEIDLAALAYTLQVGREAFKERLGLVVSSVDELAEKLRAHLTGTKSAQNIYRGQAGRDQDALAVFGADADLQETVNKWIARRKFASLLDLWVKGLEVDWNELYAGQNLPRRIGLPTYPFAKERYWPASRSLPAAVDSAKPARAAAKQRLSYSPRWQVGALERSAAGSSPFGSILILDTSDELFLTMKEQLAGTAQSSAVLVTAGESFQEIAPDRFTINIEREADFQQLLASLASRDQLPQQVLHRCAAPGDCDGTDGLDGTAQLSAQLNHGIYALLYLCKTLMAHKRHAQLRILSVFCSDPGATPPQDVALAGFFKTLMLENPKYLAKVVDIRTSTSTAVSIVETARLVIEEFQDKTWRAAEVRYQEQLSEQLPGHAHRYVRHVRELALYRPGASALTDLPLKQRGTYIVSGGLGGLGFIFCEYLATNFHARLVLLGRSTLTAAQEGKLRRLQSLQPQAIYLQADVSKWRDVERAVLETKTRFAQINGVIHAAGVNRDSFVFKKTREEMQAVLAPKVFGVLNLDRATRGENLDLFMMFSSVAATMGNPGQCDYAYGNHFLDAFAERREQLRSQQKRSGRSLSVNWPFWMEGGMTLSQSDVARTEAQAGLSALPTREGIRYWEEFLRSDLSQAVALYGNASKIEAYLALHVVAAAPRDDTARPAPTPTPMDPAVLAAETETYLKRLIGEEIKLSVERIDSRERFESFGIDSIVVGRLNATLARDLGALPKTLFYEYETIEELAKYLAEQAHSALLRFFGLQSSAVSIREQVQSPEKQEQERQEEEKQEEERQEEERQEEERQEESEQIAIIGVHGYYPGSKDLDEYWQHLREGRDLVGLVPSNRWDSAAFYHSDPGKATDGKIYCKWGAFLEDFDKFDASFFNIPAEEAKVIDPQERLFLSSVWAAVEDAGYTRDSLRRYFPKGKSADVGVFVGVTNSSYQLLAAHEWSRGNVTSPSALPWSIANRVSYFFDFQGPSLPVDTACSSSLVALHLACESLRKRQCQVAIAGGVNLYLHPAKYHSLCQRRMLALGGKCRSFGAGDDGFVPGEGVGTLVLKPLSKAIQQGDQIYAVIAASAFAHAGRSNGYGAPNPNSQANLIGDTLSKARIHPESIGYVEGHGTGTQLGDSLEIAALTQAFRKQTAQRQFCPVGSVKANLGHSESAAGIAGVTKILLQMKHRQLVPTLHSDEVNPNIEFEGSPFYLQHGLTAWQRSGPHPRRALINSFGAGGVNACVVLEERETPSPSARPQATGPYLVVLSAKKADRLLEYAKTLLAHVEKAVAIDLAGLSYTLQVGREAMPERLAIVVTQAQELVQGLGEWLSGKSSAGIYRGSLDPHRAGKQSSKTEHALRALLDTRDLSKLAEAWTAGEEVDWQQLYSADRPARVSLPVYPFAKERHWISDCVTAQQLGGTEQQNSQLHPLVSCNSSTLNEVSFSSVLSASEFYALDHKVNGQMIFPGAGFLEIACVSAAIAGAAKVVKIQDVLWVQPLVFTDASQMIQTSLKAMGKAAQYVITSCDEDREKVVHSEGVIHFQDGAAEIAAVEETLPIEALQEQCSKRVSGAHCYDLFEKSGISYGPAFRTLQELYIGDSFALSKLRIADQLTTDFEEFILHPCMVDGALQTVAGLLGGVEASVPHLPFSIDEVAIIRSPSRSCYVHAQLAGSEQDGHAEVKKFNVKIANEQGLVLVSFKNFCVRSFKFAPSSRQLIASQP